MSREIFTTVPAAKVPYSNFDLTHNRKLSCNIGELVPVLCQEVIPGDKWNITSEVFARLAPLVTPMMHRMNIFLHGFFVPMRLIHDIQTAPPKEGWEKFISGQTTLPDATYVASTYLGTTVPVGGLSDHLGIPTGTYSAINGTELINIMPHIAYHMIWQEYYRDQNLETGITDWVDPQFQADLIAAPLKKRAWEKDYFTSCWPWAQKGVASAAVIEVSDDQGWIGQRPGGSVLGGDIKLGSGVNSDGSRALQDSGGGAIYLDGDLTLDISELRRANKMQIWMERTARSGSRLTEFLKGHFGVWPKDDRLDRPEYIGGSVVPFVISDIVNTSGFIEGSAPVEAEPLPMGALAGKGTAYGTTKGMYCSAEEHGYIMIIMSIRPEAVYYQGLPRMFSRKTYLDFPFPEFADMGEQEVLNKEIFLKDSTTNGINDALFGYQSRYADYKFIPNTLHGTFRTTNEMWTMARKFADTPDLNDDFIHVDETDDDLQRVFAVLNVEHVYMQVSHRISASRPLPFFNIPSLE